MSEEKTVYVTGSTTTYKTANDMYEEFLKRTGIDPVKIESWGRYMRTGEIKIWLKDGDYIIYGIEES